MSKIISAKPTGQGPRKYCAYDRRHGFGMHGSKKLEDNPVVGHGVQHSGQRKHGPEKARAQREDRADVYNPLDRRPADLVVNVREWCLGILKNIHT